MLQQMGEAKASSRSRIPSSLLARPARGKELFLAPLQRGSVTFVLLRVSFALIPELLPLLAELALRLAHRGLASGELSLLDQQCGPRWFRRRRGLRTRLQVHD